MPTSHLLRHQLIKNIMAPHAEKVADAVDLWSPLATQIISIIGVGGFNSLYTRSVFLTRSTYPWLMVGAPPPQADQRFEELKTSLQNQIPAQANAANILLLTIFTDTLSSIIGEALTANILHAAWNTDVSDAVDNKKLLAEPTQGISK